MTPSSCVAHSIAGNNSVAVCDQIQAIDKKRIIKIGELTFRELNLLED